MKKLFPLVFALFTLLALSIFPAPALAVDFAWDDPDNPAGTVTGYVFYFNEKGETDNPFVGLVDYPTMEYSVDDNRLVPGTVYEFWVTAYNADNESDKSNILEYTAPALFQPPAIRLPPVHVPSRPGSVTIRLKVVMSDP